MSPTEIIQAAAEVTGVTPASITSPRRTPAAVNARTVAVALIRQNYPGLSVLEIAEAVGRICHGSALHHLRRSSRPEIQPLIQKAAALLS